MINLQTINLLKMPTEEAVDILVKYIQEKPEGFFLHTLEPTLGINSANRLTEWLKRKPSHLYHYKTVVCDDGSQLYQVSYITLLLLLERNSRQYLRYSAFMTILVIALNRVPVAPVNLPR